MGRPLALRFVLFDLVGTLLDERADFEALDEIMTRVRRRFRLEADVSELSGQFALAVMEIIHDEPQVDEAATFMPFHEAAPDVFAGLLEVHGYQVSDADKAWFWNEYLDIQRDTWRAYKDAAPALRALDARGLTIGTLTDADRYLLDDILPRLPIDPFLTVRVSAEESGHVKPHPASFSLALDRAGVSPDEALMVGDSYERDLAGANAAGIAEVVLLDRHQARTVEVPTIHSLSALSRVVAGLSDGRPQA